MAILFNPANARVQTENGFSDYKFFVLEKNLSEGL